MKKITVLFIPLLLSCAAFSQQPRFSLATDLSVLKNFGQEQRFWAIGQTMHAVFHITPKDGAYAWLSYYSNGKFSNDLQAGAKDPVTLPQSIDYVNNSEMKLKHISIGWRHYLLGRSDVERGFNVYHYIGFGLMFGRVTNQHSVSIDTSDYILPVARGTARFKRLTLDLGLGLEKQVGGDVYLYLEGRALLPTTDYPSRHMLRNEKAPFTGAVNTGIRILF